MAGHFLGKNIFPFWEFLKDFDSIRFKRLEDCQDFPICYVSVKITFWCGKFCS